MSIEVVVRPATATSILRTQTSSPSTVSQDEEASITWGAGPLGTVERSNAYGTTSYSSGSGSGWDWDSALDTPAPPPETPQFVFDEIERKTHTVRITDPSNSANYVDVEVIDVIAFNSQFGIYIYRFTNPR